MAVHEKAGAGNAGVTQSGREHTVEMTVRVVVAAGSSSEAIERVGNTANWKSWQWVGPRAAGEN